MYLNGNFTVCLHMWASVRYSVYVKVKLSFHVSVVAHHRTIFRVSSLLPPYGIWTPIIRLGDKHLYPLSHLAGTNRSVSACTRGCEGLRGRLFRASSHLPSLLRQRLSSVGLYCISQASWPLSFQPILHFISLYVFCLHVCLYTICISSAQRGQKRVWDPRELELYMVTSHHGVLGLTPRFSGKATSVPNLSSPFQEVLSISNLWIGVPGLQMHTTASCLVGVLGITLRL